MTTFPVVEMFGPTVQGEGKLAGQVTHFVRFGGCDYRCSWCDSLFAVLPDQVRANATKLTSEQITEALLQRPPAPWVTLSGGNPAMMKLPVEFIHGLQELGMRVSVETQGSLWKDWLAEVDCLTVSPKPPSSGMATDEHAAETHEFLLRATSHGVDDALKIVVFDDADLDWADELATAAWNWPLYLSVGTDPPEPDEPFALTLAKVADRYKWLCEAVSGRVSLHRATVLPQLHVIAWGHSRGV